MDEDVHGAVPPRARRESTAGFRAKMGSNSGTMASADEGLLLVKERYQEFMTTQISVSNLVRTCARLQAAVARSAAQCDCVLTTYCTASQLPLAHFAYYAGVSSSRGVCPAVLDPGSGAPACAWSQTQLATRTPERPPRDLTPTVRDAQSCAPWACASSFRRVSPPALEQYTATVAKEHAH
jgi:hypothetical protein